MKLSINDRGSLPLTQPYNMSPWNYAGDESVTSIPNANVVDWVLLELRETDGDASTATSATIVGQKAVFLLSNGSIVDMDGLSLPEFEFGISDNLFVVLWHRNHLGIMSGVPVENLGGIYTYDFSSAELQVYGGIMAHKEIGSGIWGMVAADGDANGIINMDDKFNTWMAQSGLSGYYTGDFNMDIQIDNKDKNDLWLNNSGYNEQVP